MSDKLVDIKSSLGEINDDTHIIGKIDLPLDLECLRKVQDERYYKDMMKAMAAQKEKPSLYHPSSPNKPKAAEPKIAPIYERLNDKTAMLTEIPNICPECLCTCEVNFTPDKLRVSIKHHDNTCSRSLTEIIRPIAQFTVFI